jgi:FHS family L-fucose permease-like MFS transporter
MTTSNRGSLVAFISVTLLFFAWGFITNLIDPLIPAVMGVFGLKIDDAFLTQFAFFIAYGVFSLPGGALVAKIGYSKTILISLSAMIVACLIFPLATNMGSYNLMLVALFILGGGITVLQVAANPLSAALGDPRTSHSRLVLSQAFNSLGTVLGPFLGAAVMLSGGLFAASAAGDVDAARAASINKIDTTFLTAAAMLVLLVFFMWSQARRITESAPPAQAEKFSIMDALRAKWALAGGFAIFVYVGAEVAIASIMINFLQRPDVIGDLLHEPGKTTMLFFVDFEGDPAERAGKMLGALYWFGAMVGRFAGSWLLTRIKAPHLLAIFATMTTLLCLLVSQTHGTTAAYAALSVGLFNSIMFPAIFTITLERSKASVAATSGLLCMSIVGGAIIPQIVARIAGKGFYHEAYFVPLVCYALIVVFALRAAKAPIVSHGAAPASGH